MANPCSPVRMGVGVCACVCVVSMQSVSEHYKQEMEGLQKKLKWYAENQQLLDKDSALLKQKDVEIAQLAEKLRQLRTDVSCVK